MIHVLTLEEVADALRMSVRWVEGIVQAGLLRSFLLGSRRRVTIEALQEFIRRCEMEGEPLEVEARTEARTVAPRLSAPPAPLPPRAAALPPGLRRVSLAETARSLIGTSGAPRGSHSRQRGSRRSTSSTPESPSTSGGPSSRGGES